MSPRTSWAALRLVLACLLCLPPATMAAPASTRERSLEAEDGSMFRVTLGTLRVPEMHAEPAAATRTIELAFVRLRRSGQASRTAHVVLAGGPGDSGVDLVLGLAKRGGASVDELFQGDIIGIDQRGTGRSSPSLAVDASYDLPPYRAGSAELWLPLMERAVRSTARQLRARGIRLEAYNTRESAADVEAVRRALGYDRLTLWGRSYGTHLALAVLRAYPDNVERMILVSPEGPDHTWKLPSQADAMLQRLSERAHLPDLLPRMRAVLGRLERAPVTVRMTDPATGRNIGVALGAFDLRWLTAQALGDPRTLATLPAAYRRMERGDFSGIAALALMYRRNLGVQSAMKQLMDLSSGASPTRQARIEHEASRALLGDSMNFPGRYLFDAWQARDLGDAHRAPVVASVPTLILVGDLDPRTPVSNGVEIAATLPQAQLVVLENATHRFDVFGSPPIRAVLSSFLRGESRLATRVTLPPLQLRE